MQSRAGHGMATVKVFATTVLTGHVWRLLSSTHLESLRRQTVWLAHLSVLRTPVGGTLETPLVLAPGSRTVPLQVSAVNPFLPGLDA